MSRFPTQDRYSKRVVRHIGVDLNRNTEPELIAQVEKQPAIATYIKKLIRADIEGRVKW